MSHLSQTISSLRELFPSALVAVNEYQGETTLVIAPENLLAVAQHLRNELAYNFLEDLAAVDYFPQEPRFAVSYILLSMANNTRLRLKVFLEGEEPGVDSLANTWLSANWHEREAFDLMGIQFKGHPDLRRILMPADWQGHPHRKDYPLGYEEVQFSFNWRDIDNTKSYAKDRAE